MLITCFKYIFKWKMVWRWLFVLKHRKGRTTADSWAPLQSFTLSRKGKRCTYSYDTFIIHINSTPTNNYWLLTNDVQNRQNHSVVMLQVTTESGNITYLAIFFGSLDFFFQEWLGLSSFVSGISCPLTFANKKQTFVKELFMAPQWTEHRTWSTWHLVLVAAVISTLSKQQPVTYTHVTFFNGLTPAQSRPRANNYGPNVDCRVSHSTSCLLVKFHHATILYKNSYLLFISFTGELSVDNQINRFFHGDSGDSYEKSQHFNMDHAQSTIAPIVPC